MPNVAVANDLNFFSFLLFALFFVCQCYLSPLVEDKFKGGLGFTVNHNHFVYLGRLDNFVHLCVWESVISGNWDVILCFMSHINFGSCDSYTGKKTQNIVPHLIRVYNEVDNHQSLQNVQADCYLVQVQMQI